MSSKRNIVIFTVDNTLRDASWRLNLIPIGTKRKCAAEWLKFHRAGIKDEPIKPIMTLLKMYLANPDYDVYLWANSVEACREDVRKWLNKQGVLANSYAQLFLRPDGNQLANKEVYERWLMGMPQEELGRVNLVVTNDDAMAEVFGETHVDVLHMNKRDVL